MSSVVPLRDAQGSDVTGKRLTGPPQLSSRQKRVCVVEVEQKTENDWREVSRVRR